MVINPSMCMFLLENVFARNNKYISLLCFLGYSGQFCGYEICTFKIGSQTASYTVPYVKTGGNGPVIILYVVNEISLQVTVIE